MTKREIERILPKVQKPGRYTGGELGSVVKDRAQVDCRVAFCFPDVYEVGMSHLGIKILYGLYNTLPGVWCERVFAPWVDMEAQMRERQIPLYALESGDPLMDFDLIAFTLQYELSYTNVLNMLDLAGLPIQAADRADLTPLVIAGGPCACNPEPLCDFVDLFVLGEGEEVSSELIALLREHKQRGGSKKDFLREAARIPGVYVPSLYEPSYHADGTIASVAPRDDTPARVEKRIVRDLDGAYFPDEVVVPFLDIVHDRVMTEVFRGCIRGCRFCQAGFIYRPVREKSPGVAQAQARALCDRTGYDEVSLTSLSTSDYTGLPALLPDLLTWSEGQRVNVSLPSLRADNFSAELAAQLARVRKSGLTFAPEAGTQRLRDVINKNVTEDDVLETCRTAFAGGHTAVKLYFMMGLPTETLEDVAGIAALGQRVVNAYYHQPDKPKGKAVRVSLSVACFVPKPFTPFQWEPQDTREDFTAKQKHLLASLTTRKISCSWHDAETSVLEAVFARGDRRLGRVLEEAWRAGCRFDSWDEHFKPGVWRQCFAASGLNPDFYAHRRRAFDEVLPWDHLDFGVEKAFLIREAKRAVAGETTPHCRAACAGCGASRLNGGVCG